MKKTGKRKISFRKGGFNITIDENLNKLKGQDLGDEKLEDANRQLRKIKSLPK
jgi:hypothetical protein